MTSRLTLGVAAVLLLTACAGRDPDPVAEIQPGDSRLSCTELRHEIGVNGQAASSLMAEQKDKQTQNVVAGAAGAILFAPALFFMDLKGASGEEARAYQRRNQGLLNRYTAKGCRPEIRVETQPAVPTATKSDSGASAP